MQIERAKTGVPGLDEMLKGGFIRDSAILVRGAPGTGKTILALHYLLEGAKQGEPGLLITFEEFEDSLYRDAEGLGWDLRAYEKQNLLRIYFTTPDIILGSLQSMDSPLIHMIEESGIRRVALDSLTHFSRIATGQHALRQLYNTVVNAFKREQITALYLSEEHGSDMTSGGRGRISFVVDCMIILRYLEIKSEIKRAVAVLKMRSSDHDKAIHSYEIGQGGITVGDMMEGHVGLLSGLIDGQMISTVN